MPRIATALLCLALSGSLLSPRSATADTLTIAPTFYHIDQQKHLILINRKPTDLNAGGTQKTHLDLNETYTFSQPLTTITTDLAYQAEHDGTRFSVYFTELPVVSITARKPIQDTPSIYARLSLAEPAGTVTESALGIEFRGGYSQTYPKKSYELSFWKDSTGAASRDVQLLGMRTDNKYNLQAMYNEPLRVRNKVSFELWQEIHEPYYRTQEPEAKSGIAIQYVELFLNGTYQGVYALTERIDRKQLKLKKYSNGITGELYKGADWGPAVTFSGALPAFDNASKTWGGFEYKHPEEQTDWSSLYNFADFVRNSSDQEFFSTVQQKFNLRNAVDYYLFLNLTRATDNTGKNLYIAKYKKGEPYFYVPWDLDGVFGTDWTGNPANVTNDLLTNGFYDRLWQDCSATGFRAALRTRWAELRRSTLTEDHILAKFRTHNNYLTQNNVYEREQLAWADFHPVPDQLTYTATWLGNRLRYLDTAFGASCNVLTANAAPATNAVQLFPNPTTDYLSIRTTATATDLCLRDLRGQVVLQAALRGPLNQLDLRHLPKGLYLATLRDEQRTTTLRVVLH
ncbi:CotH kinase family protein [Hymenobacter rubripertinctus]|nr:CotH kinase family protein [Hymenobacter rubripertinctus]